MAALVNNGGDDSQSSKDSRSRLVQRVKAQTANSLIEKELLSNQPISQVCDGRHVHDMQF
jgi:hypothetical protein